MPLEDLIGSSKYVSDLNANWPDGATDYLDKADDHLRGIKNALKNTFPNITGPVTRTQTSLNTGSVPSGSTLLFHDLSAAPSGWIRAVIGNSYDYGIRVVGDSTSSATGGGGSDDPKLMNKVPSHTHTVSGNTWDTNLSHSHGLVMNAVPDHTHTFTRSDVQTGFAGGGAYNWNSNLSTLNTGAAGGHTPSGTIQSSLGNHSHSFSAITAVNASASNWTPRYLNFMMCKKS